MYELKGNEKREESTETIECGDIITVKYFNGDKLVRVDKQVMVSAEFLALAAKTGFEE